MTIRPNRADTALRLADGRVIKLPAVMGVLNVTPDSFSDGGRFLKPELALEHALAMEAAGAAIIDLGAESTRPAGGQEVPAEVELARLLPVLELLQGKLKAPLSIDTRKAVVARQALRYGAAIINDVSALADPAMASLAAQAGCTVILMHMRGGPADHMKFARYGDLVAEVLAYLRERVSFARQAGIRAGRIVIDPGLGFAKTARHNLELMRNLPRFGAVGCPVLIGASRKRFVRSIAGEKPVEVEAGNAVINGLAILGGAAILRVHDVPMAMAAMRMAVAVARGE